MTSKKVKEDNKKVSQITVIDWETGKTESLAAPSYLHTEVSPRLISQVLHTLRKRMRIRRAHTKERADVRGGGRKPWKQKGTGNSRHGSTRSPLWVGGGTTFGPRARHERVVPVPLAMKRRALTGALNQHYQAGKLSVVRLSAEAPVKTKDFIGKLPQESRGLLLVVDSAQTAGWARVARNVTGIAIASADKVTVRDLMVAQRVFVDERALPAIERRVAAKANQE